MMKVNELSTPKLAGLITGCLAVAIALGWTWLGLFGGNNGRDSDAENAPARAASTVRYEVTGDTSRTNVTVSTPSGTSQQSASVPIVNKNGGEGLVFKMPAGSFAYISAQNDDDDSYGPITCTITIDGVKVSENTSSGQFSIATCKART